MNDDSYTTRIPNSLFTGLLLASSSLTKRELIVLLVVIRNTVGWHRSGTKISSGYIAEATGIDRANAFKALNSLAAKGFVSVEKHSDKTSRFVTLNADALTVVKTTTDAPDQSVVKTTTDADHLLSKRPQHCCQNDHRTVVNLTTNKERKKELKKEEDEDDLLDGLI